MPRRKRKYILSLDIGGTKLAAASCPAIRPGIEDRWWNST